MDKRAMAAEAMRRPDWPERMAEALAIAEKKSFSETYFCAAFAADVVLAMTDVDPLPWRAETLVEAYAKMREAGFQSIQDALAAHVGEQLHVAMAQRGDVVLRLEDGRESVGICCGVESAFISSEGGLAYWPTIEQAAAYRVGAV